MVAGGREAKLSEPPVCASKCGRAPEGRWKWTRTHPAPLRGAVFQLASTGGCVRFADLPPATIHRHYRGGMTSLVKDVGKDKPLRSGLGHPIPVNDYTILLGA